MQQRFTRNQQGVALPVVLIILLVMLISSVYLLRSSNSTTLTATNLAYDAAQARAVDHGLQEAYLWLARTARTNKVALNAHSNANGYDATVVDGQSPRADAFWQRARLVNVPSAPGQQVQYVIHRLCLETGVYNAPTNRCTRTADNPSATAKKNVPGKSLGLTQPLPDPPKLHYLVTARITGARGGNVVTQLVVQIAA